MRQERPFNAVGQAMGISDRMVKIYVARAGPSMRVSAGPYSWAICVYRESESTDSGPPGACAMLGI